MNPLPSPPLLVITDRRQARLPLEQVAAQIFAAGCRWLSLREKDLPAAERRALLARLVALGREHDATVMVHEDVEAALAAGAAGVHLPAGGAIAAARARLGAKALVGISAHDVRELGTVAAAGADYATLSPIFLSRSKPGYGPALGLAALARGAAATAMPVLALGGIGAAEVAPSIAAGAAGVAVMGAAMAADSAAPIASLLRALAGGLARRSAARHHGAPEDTK